MTPPAGSTWDAPPSCSAKYCGNRDDIFRHKSQHQRRRPLAGRPRQRLVEEYGRKYWLPIRYALISPRFDAALTVQNVWTLLKSSEARLEVSKTEAGSRRSARCLRYPQRGALQVDSSVP